MTALAQPQESLLDKLGIPRTIVLLFATTVWRQLLAGNLIGRIVGSTASRIRTPNRTGAIADERRQRRSHGYPESGAGLPVFVGPAIVGLFIGSISNTGVIWILAVLYLISAILTHFISLPDNARTSYHVKDKIVAKPLAG